MHVINCKPLNFKSRAGCSAWEISCVYQVILSACMNVKMNAHTSVQNQRMFLVMGGRYPMLQIFKIT